MSSTPHDISARLYLIADEINSMAAANEFYADNPYQVERAERMKLLAAEMVTLLNDTEPEINGDFEVEPWMSFSPWVGVEAFVLDDDEHLLLIQRADNSKWALPGGLCEVGRSFSETAIIELWEEAGVRGEVVGLLGVFDTRTTHRFKTHGSHIVYHIKADDPTPNIGVECLKAEYVSREEALSRDLHSGHYDRINTCWNALATANTAFDPASHETVTLGNQQRPEAD